MKFVATKKCLTKKFFSPVYLFLDPGSEIRDPGSGMGKNQDPGSGINIPSRIRHTAIELQLFEVFKLTAAVLVFT